jgi:hypothetical protein
VFENIGTLGTGAFGDVYKVKCTKSSCINENRTERIEMSQL